ncbi:hypothetical protein RQP46_007522 [Phenoliferia psychrophenolica]
MIKYAGTQILDDSEISGIDEELESISITIRTHVDVSDGEESQIPSKGLTHLAVADPSKFDSEDSASCMDMDGAVGVTFKGDIPQRFPLKLKTRISDYPTLWTFEVTATFRPIPETESDDEFPIGEMEPLEAVHAERRWCRDFVLHRADIAEDPASRIPPLRQSHMVRCTIPAEPTPRFTVSGSHFSMNFLFLAIQSTVCASCIFVAKWTGLIAFRGLGWNAAQEWVPISLVLVTVIYTSSKSLQCLSIYEYTIFKNLTLVVAAYGEIIWFGGFISRFKLYSFGLIVRRYGE